MSRRLALHIGHSKTGSSYMQSALALSREALATSGVVYPDSANARRALKGFMTTGNADDLRAAIGDRAPARWSPPDGRTVLYSAEHLAPLLAANGGADALGRLAAEHGFGHIDILLVIRDPMDHLLSEYSQKIKGGQTTTLGRLSRKYGFTILALKLIQALSDRPDVTLTVMNYRRIRDDLTGAVAGWIGVPPDIITAPERRIINRALTRDELAFQRRLNAQLERSGHIIAEPLVNELPGQSARPPVLGRRETRAFFRRLRPSIRAVNRTLPREDRYRTGGPLRLWTPRRLLAGLRRGGVTLNDEQVDVIVKGFAAEIERAKTKPRAKGE